MSASPEAPSGQRRSFVALIYHLLNHDFCPWANHYVYWLKQPIGWFLVGAAAAGLTAYYLAPHAWIIFGSLVVVILLGVVWPWIAIRGVTAQIEFDRRRGREDEPMQVRLQIINRCPWPLWGLSVEKGFFALASDEQPVVALARIPGWTKSEFVFEFRPDRRGVYPHEAPELASGFPFGLWRAHRVIDVARPLLVWPQTTSLNSIPSLGGDVADVIGMLFDRPGNEGDTIGVRPFQEGDRLRSIHWGQTARRDSFIVKERQAAARRPVAVDVDLEAFAGDDASQKERLEVAIRVAASVAQGFHSHHAQVRFVMGDLDLLLEPGNQGLKRLLDSLARFDSEADHSTASRYSHDTLVVVVTSRERQGACLKGRSASQVRFVLIDSEDSDAAVNPIPSGEGRRAWIRLDDTDYARQLRRQWDRVCHDSVTN